MAIAFPAVCPVRRTYDPGAYATKRFTAINGVGVTRLYGDKAFDAQLTLEFNATDAETTSILEAWHAAKGSYSTLTMPAEVFGGMSSDLQDQIPDYLEWRFADKPQVESLLNGRSRVRTNFVANLE